MHRVNSEVIRQCSQGSCYCENRVNVNDVKKACRSLEGEKSDVCEGITSVCFVHGCDELSRRGCYSYFTRFRHLK